jgi:transcriptional regulator with XRE-family HTH domain
VRFDAEAPDVTADRARLDTLRCHLGATLAAYRRAAGISQPELGQALGRARSLLSKVENGTRGMPAALWEIADDLCRADGALVAEHGALTEAERTYRDRCRAHHRQAQIRRLAEALPADSGHEMRPDAALAGNQLVAGELVQMLKRIVRSLPRRDAARVIGWALAVAGLSGLDLGLDGLDPDEQTRMVNAIVSPSRVDTHVVNNLAFTLASCKRQEDKLGPGPVLDTVTAQHQLVHYLLDGGCPLQLRKSLSLVDSNMACTMGWYLIELGHHDAGRRYLEHARRAAHDASNAVCGAYVLCSISNAAFLRSDTPTALDAAAAARSLAARTDDTRLKATAEQHAAAAYALDGQYGPCMAANHRAHDLLASANGSVPESPAYWVNHGIIDSLQSTLLSLLGRPQQALEAASSAHTGLDSAADMVRYGFCTVRLGHALILSKEVTEAARVLGQAATLAHLSPRLTSEFHAARGLMQPWHSTPAVKTLDAQLHACGLRNLG